MIITRILSTWRIAVLLLLAAMLPGCSNLHQLYHQGGEAGSQLGLLPDYHVHRSHHRVFPPDSGFYIAWNAQPVASVLAESAGYSTETPGTWEISAAEKEHAARIELERQTAASLYQQTTRRFPRTALATAPESMHLALLSARSQNLGYVIFPRLLLWKDTVGNWTEMAYSLGLQESHEPILPFGLDAVHLQLTVLESSSGAIVDVVFIDTHTGLLTLFQEQPQRLLHAVLDQYVDSLYPY